MNTATPRSVRTSVAHRHAPSGPASGTSVATTRSGDGASAVSSADSARCTRISPAHCVTRTPSIRPSSTRSDEPAKRLQNSAMPSMPSSPNRSSVHSTGWSDQGPYGFAMVIREHFPEPPNGKLEFLATDVSDRMLNRCRDATYSQFEIGRGLPARLLVSYFERSGTAWRVVEDVRSMVRFEKLNLVTPFPPMPAWDIVFIRNVLIYFEDRTKEDVLARIRRTMSPDGYLFLGTAEMVRSLPFERFLENRVSYYRPAA
ncbi:MAG: CheR family methyltransferase [Planctomycetota bacterium]